VATIVGLTCSDTPPAAGRAWVPGCRARTLVVRTTVLRRNHRPEKTC